MQAASFYQERIIFAKSQIIIAEKKVRLFTFLRLLIFIGFSIALYFLWGAVLPFILTLVIGITAFLFFVNRSVDAKLFLEKSKELKRINENEVKALNGDWSMFDAGLEFQDGTHSFSNDIDIFSKKGVFGYVNRTVSASGKQQLADLILHGSKDVGKDNAIIEALSEQIGWTQDFRISGSIASREGATQLSVHDFVTTQLLNPKWMKVMSFLIPLITIPTLILSNLEIIPGVAFTLILVLAIMPTGNLLKGTNAIAAKLGKYESKIATMLEQIESLEHLEAKDPAVLDLISKLKNGDEAAAKILKKWMKIHQRFELRMNIVVSIPLNIFFAWDMHQRTALSKWMEQYKDQLMVWEKALTTLEVYISGATLRYNHPETVYAVFSEEDNIHIDQMLHPLLSNVKAVSNNVQMPSENQFMILTGPNMAGKSTYLRAVGLIFVFANAGFPVFAKAVSIPRLKLYSSMRTSDDLANESSYFHAELMRLKFIMNAIENDQKIFILLDEILKGTNSKDKEEGSKKFLKKLQSKGAKGIIATHDLSLCQLSEGNNVFSNGCFDSIIEGENLYFDYTWKPGICQNMNASFLLKQMNLVD